MKKKISTTIMLLLSRKQVTPHQVELCKRVGDVVLEVEASAVVPNDEVCTFVVYELFDVTVDWVSKKTEALEQILTAAGLVPVWSQENHVPFLENNVDPGQSFITIKPLDA